MLCLERSLARIFCITSLLLLAWFFFIGVGLILTCRRCGGRAFWRWLMAMLIQPVQQHTKTILNMKNNFVEDSLIYIPTVHLNV